MRTVCLSICLFESCRLFLIHTPPRLSNIKDRWANIITRGRLPAYTFLHWFSLPWKSIFLLLSLSHLLRLFGLLKLKYFSFNSHNRDQCSLLVENVAHPSQNDIETIFPFYNLLYTRILMTMKVLTVSQDLSKFHTIFCDFFVLIWNHLNYLLQNVMVLGNSLYQSCRKFSLDKKSCSTSNFQKINFKAFDFLKMFQ